MGNKIVVGVVNDVAFQSRADDKISHRLVRAVVQPMPDGCSCGPRGAVARTKQGLGVFNQHGMALQEVDHLILGFMPMAVARTGARRQLFQEGAELGQPAGVGQKAVGVGAGARTDDRMGR